MVSQGPYDVFLSHASQDKPAVEDLARRLRRRRLKPFLDKWHLVPGEPWQEALEEALDQSRTFAVFIGPGGIGPWQNEEMRDALDSRVRDKSLRVIPVLLPGASMPEEKELPRFLRRLTWVDFRGGLDDAEALHRLVSGIKGVAPEDGPAAHVPPSPARATLIGVPHRNPLFAGRVTLLEQLHRQLQKEGISALAQAAIHGLGGIGKTQTAIEYAHRFGEHYRFVLWVVAESESAIRAAYLSIARELGLVEAEANLDAALLAVKAWLSREDGWLLIFDNADDPALLRGFLPPVRRGGKVLLTSRAKTFSSVGIREPFRVETLDPEDAARFLIERTRDGDAEAASALAAELGHLPLALEQAAAYIETVGGGLDEYLARYRRQGVALFAKGKPTTDYPRTVATTWTLSFDAVREASPASAELLTVAAFLVPDSIPIEIFTLGGSELGGQLAEPLKGADEDQLVFWELLEPLERYSLIERLPDDAFKLHRLTQEVVKDSLGEEGRQDWAERIVRALDAAYPSIDFSNWGFCEKLQPHALHAAELVKRFGMPSARLLSQAGYFASLRGDLTVARDLEEQALEIRERVDGAEHPKTLVARNNLAETLRDLGDVAGARRLHEQILEIRERVLGIDHPDTLLSRNNLAESLGHFKDLAGARKLHEQNLEIRERVLGVEHPDTMKSRNNLAETLKALGDLATARKLHEQTLDIRERVLGVEHPDTLLSRSNLASTLWRLGDLAGARNLEEQVLEIRERVLGGEHPGTTVAAWNLLLTVRDLKESDAGARLIDKLRWLLDRDEGSIPSAKLREIRQDLIQFLETYGPRGSGTSAE